LGKSELLAIDYLSLVDAATLESVPMIHRPAILAAACFYGRVRLIDHVELSP
jgi:pantoate--beta-alanine ligase